MIGVVGKRPAGHDRVTFPALLRGARLAYGSAIRARLEIVGCEDMPRNGSYVVAGIARTDVPLGEIIEHLGVSKQAAGQLVDTLVLRGYLERTADPQDRRRLRVSLTDRGVQAADATRAAVRDVDAELTARVGPQHVAQARAALAALVEIGQGPLGPGPLGPGPGEGGDR